MPVPLYRLLVTRAAVAAACALALPSAQAAGVWSDAPTTKQWSSDYQVPRPAGADAQPDTPPAHRPVATQGSAAAAANASCVAGTAVWYYEFTHWEATIADGPDTHGRCLIRYARDAFAPEWVPAARLKPRQAEKVGGVAAVPAGRYPCYTFDAGQTNYTYQDLVFEAGSRYSSGGKRDRYTIAQDGRISFGGPLSDAVGTYKVTGAGVHRIALVFDGDDRKSMTCDRN